MKADPQQWIQEQRCRADDAIRALNAAKKQRVGEYDERLRALKEYAEILFVKQSDSQQMEMLDAKETLTPHLKELLENPLRGLD
jgi:hypothetical protein